MKTSVQPKKQNIYSIFLLPVYLSSRKRIKRYSPTATRTSMQVLEAEEEIISIHHRILPPYRIVHTQSGPVLDGALATLLVSYRRMERQAKANKQRKKNILVCLYKSKKKVVFVIIVCSLHWVVCTE